ncbi:hypothetical protein ACJJTC_014038 [Scirpophaga incertulas]
MSIKYNGDYPVSKIRGSESFVSGDFSNEGFYEDGIQIQAFRGFEKIPRVLLSRYDISPYLKKQYLTSSPNNGKLRHIDANLQRITQDCFVIVERQNLNCLLQPSSSKSVIAINESIQNMAHLKCKICDKVYESEKKLQNHQNNKHMIVYKAEGKPQKRVSFSDRIIVHEVKEYHKCRKCPKIFEEYKLLKTHMKQRHKKRKCYICNYCNKHFVDRMFFKVHIKLHCDVCGLLLPNKLKYTEHRRNVCRVLKKHNCRTCMSSFFKFMDLKDHSYEHLGTFFICDICKDQIDTKCGVAHHISFLHSKKRPVSLYDMRNLGNERLYLCNFCEATSIDKDIIEEHLQLLPDLSNRAMTGYKDYYFCDQCLKKFDTEQDMLQHKWSHFLKTSDNCQERPKGILSNTNNNKINKIFNVNDIIPEYMKPTVVLKRITLDSNILKTILTSSKSEKKQPRKVLYSPHKCPHCEKYFSSSYCLNRHITTQHRDYESLKCKVCEETFVWPSLLETHKCIRLKLPEMPFEDARPEIHFDNLHEIAQNGFDDLNITENDDYLNTIDFEIPAPIVEITEGPETFNITNYSVPLQSLGYKLVMQEVPIEF